MSQDRENRTEREKREYFPPKIVHSETLTGRATSCAQADSAVCGAGPIQS